MTHDPAIDDLTLKAETDDHLIAPTKAAPESPRRRFILILAACLIAHAILVAILIYENRNAAQLLRRPRRFLSNSCS